MIILKSQRFIVCVIVIFLIILSELVYCYVLTQKNKELKLRVENPIIVEKPTTKIRYIERIITKESEPLTLILEKEVEIEKNGGKETTPFTGGNQPSENKWTAGVIYDGTVGGVITRNIYKTFEAGVMVTGKTAGVLATIKF